MTSLASSTSIGQRAEAAAVDYLINREYAVVDRNWRTRFCEIDIIAHRYQTVYFIEVKYRRQSRQGSGLDYITPTKLQRMRFAAQLWLHNHPNEQRQPVLGALEVSGPQFWVSNYLQLL